MPSGADVAATFCATVVDEWVRAGLTDVVLCPGSRSTPLALAVLRDGRVRPHVFLDERSAGFCTLGLGAASGRPAAVVCTSGTAAVELHPAVVEAHQAGVPLIAATADRPAELRGVGAPQTIDQTHLFGRSVRWFADPGVPDVDARETWRSLAARSVLEASGPDPGPVHLNLPFREPLLGEVGELPPARSDGRAWHRDGSGLRPGADDVEALASAFAGRRGVVVAGGGVEDPLGVHHLARTLGWPVLADPRSGCRIPRTETISHADALLRVDRFGVPGPEVVLRLGDLPASKVVGTWLAGLDAWQVGIHPHGRVVDPSRTLDTVLAGPPGATCAAVAERTEPEAAAPAAWLERWCRADAEAASAIGEVLATHPEATEPGVARAALAAVPRGGCLVVSSSMPVRDVEWFAAPHPDARVVANRGANGIDGVTSTAVGVALSGAPTVALLGDVAFLHDSGALVGLADRGVDLTLVVVDNDGGGIFSFLPQASALPDAEFERAWGTPHGVDLARLAAAHGLAVDQPTSAHDAAEAVEAAVAGGGARVVRVRTDRRANAALHRELTDAVAAALAQL